MVFPWDFDIGSALAALALALGCIGLAALVYVLVALVLGRLGDDDGGAGSGSDLVPESPIPYGGIGAVTSWPVGTRGPSGPARHMPSAKSRAGAVRLRGSWGAVPGRAGDTVSTGAPAGASGRRLAGFVLASGRLVELERLRELTIMVAPRDWWN